MKKALFFVLSITLVVMLTGCTSDSKVALEKSDSEILFNTPGTNPELNTPAESGSVAGLGTGLWHGLISVVTLIMSFFNPEVQMYEVHNTGPLYNLGFLIGAIVLFALLGFSGGTRRHR